MRIAINGMGRIGRLLFRRIIENENWEIVAVNDIMPKENLVYLLKYDSIYGSATQDFVLENDNLIAKGRKVKVFQSASPSDLPWKSLEIDMVLECSGSFSDKASANQHLEAGAKKVLLSTTGADDIALKVFGHNQPNGISELNILSPGGCMTNCSTHILYILHALGIQSAHINILHSYTSRQALVDAPHKQFRRGRAAAESIIPVDIDLHQSLNRVLPGLKGKVTTSSTRIPVANGAMANFYIQMNAPISVQQVNSLFEKAAQQEYKDILEYTTEEIVSLDIKGNTHSAIIDGTQTAVVGNHVRIVAWFDNEYGFTSRMLDWMENWK